MPAKKKQPTKKTSKVKNNTPHPGKLLVVGFVALFAIIGASYVFASKAASTGPAAISANYEFKILEDKDGNGKPSFGDTLQVRYFDIKYNVKGSPDNYKFSPGVDISCREPLTGNQLFTNNSAVGPNFATNPGDTYASIRSIMPTSSYLEGSYGPLKEVNLLERKTPIECITGIRVFNWNGKYSVTFYATPNSQDEKFIVYPTGTQ